MTALAEKFHPAVAMNALPLHQGQWHHPEPEITRPVQGPIIRIHDIIGAYHTDVFPSDRCLGTVLYQPSRAGSVVLGGSWTNTIVGEASSAGAVALKPSSPIIHFVMQLIVEIGRLEHDWDGQGSVAPKDGTVRSLLAVTQALPAETVEPEADVDSSDGSVVLRWFTPDQQSTLSIRLAGADITCAFSQLNAGPRGRVFTSDQVTPMARFLSDYDFILTHA